MQESQEREPQVTKGRGRKTTATTRRTPAATEKEAGPGAKTAVPKARGGRGSTPREKMVHQAAVKHPQANLKVDLGGERIIMLEAGTKAAAVIGVEERAAVGKVAKRVGGRRSPTNSSSSRKRAPLLTPTTWGFSWEGSLGKPEPKT